MSCGRFGKQLIIQYITFPMEWLYAQINTSLSILCTVSLSSGLAVCHIRKFVRVHYRVRFEVLVAFKRVMSFWTLLTSVSRTCDIQQGPQAWVKTYQPSMYNHYILSTLYIVLPDRHFLLFVSYHPLLHTIQQLCLPPYMHHIFSWDSHNWTNAVY